MVSTYYGLEENNCVIWKIWFILTFQTNWCYCFVLEKVFYRRFSMVILTSIVVEGLKGHCLIKWWSRPRWRGQVYALCITLLSATGEIGRMGHYAMPSSAHTLCWGVSNTLRCLLDLSKVSLCFKLYSCCYFVLRHYFYFFELLNIWLLNTFWKINLQFLKSSFFVDFLYT